MLVLASNSPRRKEILTLLGYEFTVRPSDCDETVTTKNPKQMVKQLSFRKAKAANATGKDVVIGSDTVVYCKGNILGKPQTKQEAKNMLQLLSGRTHKVYTGVTILQGGTRITKAYCSKVTMRTILPNELERYISSNEPYDKAGGYAVQGTAAAFITKIKGDFYTIVGLPACPLTTLLPKFHIVPKQKEV